MSKEVQVEVVCPKREGFSGYWAIQRFFPTGKSHHSIPADKLAELQSETMLSVRVLEEPKEPAKEPVKEPAKGKGEKSETK